MFRSFGFGASKHAAKKLTVRYGGGVGSHALASHTCSISSASRSTRLLLRSISSTRIARNEEKGEKSAWEQLMFLAKSYPDAVQLGQGYPDYQGSSVARHAAADALVSSQALNQYSLPAGLQELRKELVGYYKRVDGIDLDEDNTTILTSGTEGLFTAVRALINEGDEALVFDPCFPWYPQMVEMAGGKVVPVGLREPDFAPNFDDIRKAISPKTKLMICNTPHNPTGHCYTKEEISELAEIARENDLWVVSDEVYENVVWDGAHHRIAQEPGMFERTIQIGSASKLFSLTGWRLGWALGPSSMISKINTIHSLTSYCAATPLQHGISVALNKEDGRFEGIPAMIEDNHNKLSAALEKIGLTPYRAGGGHFLCAGIENLKGGQGLTEMDVVERLLERCGVSVLPLSMFGCGADIQRPPAIRIAICKESETIAEAVRRLEGVDLS